MTRRLCRVDEIAEPGGRSVAMAGDDGAVVDVVVVCWRGLVRAYRNACPHVGTPLETLPDRFFTRAGNHLLCTTHGARFDPGSGLCVAGPCLGARLPPVAIRVDGGDVVLAEALS